MVFAAALIEGESVLGNVEGAIAETFFDVDKNIGEVASAGHHVFRYVVAFASGILAHVNPGGLGSFAIEFYGAADAGGRGGINGSGRCRRGRRSGWSSSG